MNPGNKVKHGGRKEVETQSHKFIGSLNIVIKVKKPQTFQNVAFTIKRRAASKISLSLNYYLAPGVVLASEL